MSVRTSHALRVGGLVSLVIATGALALGSFTSARAQTVGPRMSVAPAETRIGDEITVSLDQWPQTTATVVVCGNRARRGSQDCALQSAAAVRTHEGTTIVEVPVSQPPVGCPCVVRASTPSSDLVQMGDITIEGVPGGTDIAPATATSADALTVTAEVVDADPSWHEQLVAAVGGTAHQRVRIHVQNNTDAPITGLRVNAAVGRSANDAEPIDVQTIASVAPHTTATVTVPFEISAPAFGDYVVTGKVYGSGPPVSFSTDTENDLWALWLALPIALIVIAEALRARERRRRRQSQVEVPKAPLAIVPQPVVAFAQSSPEVGTGVGNGWGSPSYDPRGVRDTPSGDPVALRAGR